MAARHPQTAQERIVVEPAQGDIYWADLDEPVGSASGFRRPVVVVQGDSLNQSRIATVVCVPLTSNMKWASAPGNVVIPARVSGLAKDSVANVSQILALDRTILNERVCRLPRRTILLILSGIDIVLGR